MLLLNAKKDVGLNDIEILHNFVLFMVGGMDSTGHLVTHLIYLLMKHPKHLNKVILEIDNVIKRDENYTYENLGKLKYLHICLKETLRSFNPNYFTFPR